MEAQATGSHSAKSTQDVLLIFSSLPQQLSIHKDFLAKLQVAVGQPSLTGSFYPLSSVSIAEPFRYLVCFT